VYDIAVVGAGPAASAYACLVARAGARVVVVGPSRHHRPGTLELLSDRAANALRALELDPGALTQADRLQSTRMRWGSDETVTRLPTGPYDGGWIVERSEFDGRLAALAQHAGAELIPDVVASAHSAGVVLADGRHIAAHRVALAAGRTSRLAARAGIPRAVRHRMVALTRWDATFVDAQPGLHVWAVPDGFWYVMSSTRGTSAGFVTDVDLLRSGPDRAQATWEAEADAAAELRGTPPLPSSGPLVLRASSVVEAVVEGSPILPLGDLALAADPLSGHGLLLALEGAVRAARGADGYRAWLIRAQISHRAGARALYTAERRYAHLPFWRRRARVPEEAG
jgi:flavin-dependent dehydrogenase